MRLIDILNKIANGELKEGTKVKYKDIDLIYEDEELVDDEGFSAADFFRSKADYNEEVELIEPDHFADVGKMANHIREDTKMIEPTDNIKEKIEELRIKVFRKDYFEFRELDRGFMDNFLEIQYKLNEVIRILNKRG